MRPTLPLLLITVLQGISGGMVLSISFLWHLVPGDRTILVILLWGAFGIGALGGVASLFHMHRPKAGRFILRRLRSSWLSREALTTGIYVFVLGIVVVVPLVVAVAPRWYDVGSLVGGILGLVAMYVTSMLYATIPAMRSWHTPLTVIGMMGVGIVTGMALAEGMLAIHSGTEQGNAVHVAWLVGTIVLAGVKWLQYRHFHEARQSLRTSTGTGMPGAPYRLIDSGTTKLPYRTQTQVWPDLAPGRRGGLYAVMGALLILIPLSLGMLPVPVAIGWGGAAVFMVGGAFVERWLFFADVTHSSKVWFGDELKRESSVSSERVSPDLVARFKHVVAHHHDGV